MHSHDSKYENTSNIGPSSAKREREREIMCVGRFGGASVSRVKAERSNHAHKNPPMDPILSQMNPLLLLPIALRPFQFGLDVPYN
jgi:hypothetical protein